MLARRLDIDPRPAAMRQHIGRKERDEERGERTS